MPRAAVMLAAAWWFVTAAGAASDPAPVPLGHRAYTYQAAPSGIISRFNAASKVPLSVVNVYGGWFQKSTEPVGTIALRCGNSSKVAARRFMVNNTNPQRVTMIGCAADSCSSSGGAQPYVHCSGSIPPHTAAVVTSDADLEWAAFLNPDGSEQSECWPKSRGAFPSITLPMADPKTECAVDPASQGPEPPVPPPPRVFLSAEPFHSQGRPSSNVSAFAGVAGVEHITLVVDGRMDLCDEYEQYNMTKVRSCAGAPDPRGVTPEALETVARSIAEVACADPIISGVQIDLEPLSPPWRNATIALIGKVADALRAPICQVPGVHPKGRAISTFTFAESVTDDLVQALGPLGYLAISGYDLYAKPGFQYNTPAEYGAKLERQVNATLALVGSDCRLPWTLGIPVAASAHEYETYSPSQYHCGPACHAFNNTATMADYVRAAFDLFRARPDVFALREGGCFRGLNMWKFDPLQEPKSGGGDYPPGSGNFWSPLGPTSEALQALEQELSRA